MTRLVSHLAAAVCGWVVISYAILRGVEWITGKKETA